MDSKNWKLVLNLIDLLVIGMKIAPEVLKAYQEARAKINLIAAEDREPTAEEHEELNALINASFNSLMKPISMPETADTTDTADTADTETLGEIGDTKRGE